MLGGWEWIIIVAAIILLFGASRLPQLAKSLGESRKAFKEGLKEAEADYDSEKKLESPKVSQIGSMSDDELAAEMRRRVESKQS